MPPRGAVPLCIINANTKEYTEIINSVNPREAFAFIIHQLFAGDWLDDESRKKLIDDINGEYTLTFSTPCGWGGIRSGNKFKINLEKEHEKIP